MVAFRPDLPEGEAWTTKNGCRVLPHLHDSVDAQGFLTKCVPAPKFSDKRVLRKVPGGHGVWDTDRGEMKELRPAEELADRHPEFFPVCRGLWINLDRMRRLEVDQRRKMRLIGDDGQPWAEISNRVSPAFLKHLGLEHSYRTEPAVPGLSRWFLRDWPMELAVASGEELLRCFDNADSLMANLFYQALRYRSQGIVKDYGDSSTGFFYDPVDPALYRSQFLTAGSAESNRAALRARCSTILEEMIEMKLLTHEALGFRDKAAHLRRIGEGRPEVVIVIEKESLQTRADQLSDEFGVSYLITGGNPRFSVIEFFVRALRKVWPGPVSLLGYVDFDAKGWQCLEATANQLQHYELERQGDFEYLVRLEDFTAEELELFAVPCPMGSKETAVMVMRWVKLTGGIGGKPKGIHANHLPLERVRKRLQEVL
jgi:hypothetical protein